ncbi:MAG: DUF58 domain-containing protein [Dehalococcoidia bacterium]|nr:DUF58 domain-containing protein [Dehalococcoidia bacterium]
MRSLVTDAWLLVSALLAGIGFTSGSVPLIVLGAMIFTTGGAARLWSRISLEQVIYRRTLSEHRVFVGESVLATLILENRKTLPVPWMELRETLPRGMPALRVRTSPGSEAGSQVLERATALGRQDHLEWPITLQAVRRGYYRVGPTRLRSGDIFGFFEREEETGRPVDGIVVYPLTYPLPDLGLDSARPFGEYRGGNRIYEDPSRVIGVREYQSGDAMKRIDWYATARIGRLQSRLYEPSREQSVIVALNIPTFELSWQGSDPVLLERGVAVAASIARWAADGGLALGLVANGSFADADRTIRIGAGRGPDRLSRVLEALAMITAFTTSNMAGDLEDPAYPLPAGATVVVVAAVMPEDLAATLLRLRDRGHFVAVVQTSAAIWDRSLAPIPVVSVAAAMEVLEAEPDRAPVREPLVSELMGAGA